MLSWDLGMYWQKYHNQEVVGSNPVIFHDPFSLDQSMMLNVH